MTQDSTFYVPGVNRGKKTVFFYFKVANKNMKILGQTSQVSYRFLALGCFPANLVSDVVCVLFVLRVGSLKG